MKPELCECEEAVAAALASGQWSDELRKHLAGCNQCADLQLVSQYLAGAARTGGDEPCLPAAGLLWWRGQLAERRERATRATAAIDVMQKLAIAVSLITVVAFASYWTPVPWGTLLMGAGLSVSTAAVLYGWARGRI